MLRLPRTAWKSIHGKGSHGYAMLFGNGANHQISLHHNLFTHNARRNPWIKDNAKGDDQQRGLQQGHRGDGAVESASEAYLRVLRHAGALPRDGAEKRAVEDARNGAGRHIDSLGQIGGYPPDGDGMPDGSDRMGAACGNSIRGN